MRKLINAPEDVVAESLAGFAAAHRDLVVLDRDGRFVRRRTLTPGKVALVSGGGAGHEPLHTGFVGVGMLDAACPGQVFTSPTPDRIAAAIAAVDGGVGVLLVVKNYAGDVMNFEMAAEIAAAPVESVVVDDDVASVDRQRGTDPRAPGPTGGGRGVAGTLVVEKIAGAAAETGDDLARVAALARRAAAGTRSIGVALSSCTVPAAGRPTFEIAAEEMEFGVGIHGERGRRRVALAPTDAVAEAMVAALVGGGVAPGSRGLLFVNGFGGTPAMELYIMFEAARTRLARHGVTVTRALVGTYVTSLEMAGLSLTFTALDPELERLWDAPVATPAFRRGM